MAIQEPPPLHAPESGTAPTKRHLRRWVLLVVVVVVVLTIVSGKGSTSKGSGDPSIQSNSLNAGHSPPADINAGWTCAADDLGQYQAQGTLTNHSSKTSTYTIHVDFIDAMGVRVDDGLAIANEVAAGQTATWKAISFTDQTAGSKCKITSVDRVGF